MPQAVPAHSWLKRNVGAPLNRYGIKPGRHWDGVDRSNGFERDMFAQQNKQASLAREARAWVRSCPPAWLRKAAAQHLCLSIMRCWSVAHRLPSESVADVAVKAEDKANWGLTVCELTVNLDCVHALLGTSVK